nr:hypothetical protein [Tanacetum cinerariifolium]
MANLTFADTHNMVAFLSKSDASIGFDQIVDFLNTQVSQYALMVNPTIYVSCIKQLWATVLIKKANDMVKLRALVDGKMVVVTKNVIQQDLSLDDADGVECLPNEEIFTELVRMGYEKPPPKLMFYKAFFSTQWKFLIHTLIQCISAKRTAWNEFSCLIASAVICLATCKKFNFSKVGKGFSGVETPLFATMLVEPPDAEEEDEVDVHATPTRPSPTIEPSPPLQEPITTPLQAQLTTPLTPPQEQPTITFESDMTLRNTLIETCTILSLKVAQLEQDKIDQALEILKLKKRVKKNCYGFSRGCIQTGEKIAEIDADEDVTLEVSAAKPTVFDDEEVIMTMAQTLINMKAKKARLLDEQIAKRLHDEEVEQAAAREKQEKDNLEKAKVLQQQLKYQSLKRKPISIAQARKNMIVYLKNMAGYKMEHFKSMTYDKVRPIFEREYNKVQTLFKPDKDLEEPQRKRVAEETLLQESFKKLKAVEVSSSHSTQDTLTIDPKEMSKEDWEIHSEGSRTYWKIVRVGGITQAYQRGKILSIQEKFAQNQQDFLDEYLPQLDDQLAIQKQNFEMEWENPFAVKRDTPFKEAAFMTIEGINESDDEQSVKEDYNDQNSHHAFIFHPRPPTKIADMVQSAGSWKPDKELPSQSKSCEHDWNENTIINSTICYYCGILTMDMARLNCPKCQLTTCALCATNYLGKTVNVKGKQPHKPEEEKDFNNNEVKLLKELLKEKTEQVQ